MQKIKINIQDKKSDRDLVYRRGLYIGGYYPKKFVEGFKERVRQDRKRASWQK